VPTSQTDQIFQFAAHHCLLTMAFSFGSTTAPAPAGGGFSFGSTPAPAPAGGNFSFGSKAPAPGFGFGASAPAPAPAGSSFSFGSPAPAPSSSLFGASPAPAFGGSSLFGTTPAPSPFGNFGAVQQQQQLPPQQAPITAYTPYSALPPEAKQMIDQIYQQVQSHRRTMYNLNHMSPALLTLPEQERKIQTIVTPGNITASSNASSTMQKTEDEPSTTGSVKPLPHQIRSLNSQIQFIAQQISSLMDQTKQMHEAGARAMDNATKEGAWPLEMIAARQGVTLTPLQNANKTSEIQEKWKRYQNQQATLVDWQEPIPSPYMWQVLQNLHHRLNALKSQVEMISQELYFVMAPEPDVAAGSPSRGPSRPSQQNKATQIASVLRSQWETFIRVGAKTAQIHDALDAIKLDYNSMLADAKFHQDRQPSFGYSTSRTSRPRSFSDPFRKADAKELEQQEQFNARFLAKMAAASASNPKPSPAPGAPAPAPTGSFFGAPVPAPSGGLFGAPAPAGGLFGAPAPAPTGGLFGGAPAPAPAGGLFGGAPAPAPSGGLFGGAPAPAPAPSGGLFGAPAPAPTGGLFGAPAPAPTGGLFGAPAPAPTGGLFAAPAPVSASATTAPAPATGLFGNFSSTNRTKKKTSGSRRR